jgi:hypothetical protein
MNRSISPDLVLLDAAVLFLDAHDDGQPQRGGRDADHDGGEDQHLRAADCCKHWSAMPGSMIGAVPPVDLAMVM